MAPKAASSSLGGAGIGRAGTFAPDVDMGGDDVD